MTSRSTSNSYQSSSLVAERERPIVLVIRHPDASDDIHLFGLPADVRVEYLDLGASFDIRYPKKTEAVGASEWVEGHLSNITDLPEHHGARRVISEVLASVCQKFGLRADGSVSEDGAEA